MPTPLQIESNQRNAEHSTGPRTEEGKQRAALNSTRHGLTGQTVVLTPEEAEPYRLFTEGFLKELEPVGTHETQLVHSVIDCRWRLNQIASTESALYALGHREHSPQFSAETPQLAAALARAVTFKEDRVSFDRLHRYESRLHRQCLRDLAALAALKAGREAREAERQEEAIQLQAYFKELGKPWNPAEFGFVWSLEEIEFLSARSAARDAAAPAPPSGWGERK